MKLKDKVVLITGGGSGLGRETGLTFAREGAKVGINDVRPESAHNVVTEIERAGGKGAKAFVADVSNSAAVKKMFADFIAAYGTIDILINNAGIGHPNRTVGELPYPTWMEVIDTNLNGLFLMTQAALAVMKRGSTIVNNLSIAAERVFPGSAAYNASKHGALGLTNTLREELRPKGIRVIALMPGATDTAIWDAMWPQAPRRKMMTAETVARTVVDALLLPENATVEKIVLMPSAGTL